MSLIEHVFTAPWFPLPKPFQTDFKPDCSCIWQSASDVLSISQQRRGLSCLFQLAQHLLAAFFSLPNTPTEHTSVVVVQLAILSCFDALVRVTPSSGDVSAVTRALSGKLDSSEEGTPYFINMDGWNGTQLEAIASKLVITNPEISSARGMH